MQIAILWKTIKAKFGIAVIESSNKDEKNSGGKNCSKREKDERRQVGQFATKQRNHCASAILKNKDK